MQARLAYVLGWHILPSARGRRFCKMILCAYFCRQNKIIFKHHIMHKLIIAALLLVAQVAAAQQKPNPDWLNQKYSMFIHFGLYSEFGGVWKGQPVKEGYSEQIQSFARIPKEEYAAMAQNFNPVKWNADEIVSLAKAAGMKSIVFTSKHHDGFCMYHSKYTDYNIVDATPFKRDAMKELSEACQRQGVKFAVYFSLIDWHFPGNTITPHNADAVTPEHHRFNMKQVEEIMTQYGPVSEIWFDMGSLTGEQSKELYDLVTRLQPQCMISGRLGNDRGDFSVMGDNQIPDYKIGTPWQTAASFFKETWSYRSWQERGSLDAKVDEKLLGMINVISRGGNYLLNIGPRGDGSVVEFERDALLKMGGWVNRYAEAIYSTTANPFDHAPAWGDITRKGNTLYLFVEHMPANRAIELNGVLGNASRAILLADSRALPLKQKGQTVKIDIPSDVQPDCGMTVVKLSFDGDFRAVPDDILKTSVLTAANAIPVYAYSSMDYYSSFQSTVGYTWHFSGKAPSITPTLLYTAGNQGETVRIEIDGKAQDIVLEGGTARPLTVKPESVKWGEARLFGPQEERFNGGDLPEGEGSLRTDIEWGKSITIPTADKQAVYLKHTLTSDCEQDILVAFGIADGFRVVLNGETLSMRTFVGGMERKPEVLKLHLQRGENTLWVELYNRYGDAVEYMIDPSIPQEMYALPLQAVELYPGEIHDCSFRLAHPANKNSDMGLRDIQIELK